MTPAEAFRVNFRRLSAQHGYSTPQEVAKALGYKLKDLRWIKRIWEKGLERPDPRRKEHLVDLADLFGVKPENLWRPEIEVEEKDIIHDPRRWAEYARAVIEAYCQFQHMKLHSQNAAITALYRYDYDEARLIADIVGDRLGLEHPLLAQLDLSAMNVVTKGDFEWKVLANDTPEEEALVEYVIEQAKGHKWFPPHFADLKKKYGDQAEQHFKKLLLDIRRRPRTAAEILEEFRALCLDSFTEDEGFEAAMREISLYLRDIWRIAMEKGGSIDPKAFAKYVHDQLNRVDSP